MLGLDAEKLSSVFADLDADGNGSINADEIVSYFGSNLEMSIAEVNKFLQSVDQDGNGEIEIHELHAAFAAKSTFRARARKALVYEAFVGSVIPPEAITFSDLNVPMCVDFDFSPGGQGLTCGERASAPTLGCSIAKEHERFVSLSSLRALLCHIRRRCKLERWRDGDGNLLTPDLVTMYDATAYVIKPATQARQCSYVELVSDRPPLAPANARRPWFVSHYWGDTVSNLVTCLETHARDRGLDANEARYWLAATSLSQWSVGGDWLPQGAVADLLSRDPRKSSFALAMAACDGVVAVVDPAGAAVSRAWVRFESFLAQELQDGATFEASTPGDDARELESAEAAAETRRGYRSGRRASSSSDKALPVTEPRHKANESPYMM